MTIDKFETRFYGNDIAYLLGLAANFIAFHRHYYTCTSIVCAVENDDTGKKDLKVTVSVEAIIDDN